MILSKGKSCGMLALGPLGLALCWGGLASGIAAGEAAVDNPDANSKPREIHVALVQFDSVPEKTEHNLNEMEKCRALPVLSVASV